MKPLLLIAGLAVCLLAPQVRADEAPKKPGPEHKKLEVFTGKWRFAEVSSPNPFWPPGKVTVKSDSRMILDGFFLEERASGMGPGGPIAWLSLLAWDDEKQHYQGSFFENSGYFNKAWKNDAVVVTVQGNTWTGKWTSEKDGKKYHCRSSNTFAADGKSNRYQFEYSEDGTTWKVFMTGEGKKVGSARSR